VIGREMPVSLAPNGCGISFLLSCPKRYASELLRYSAVRTMPALHWVDSDLMRAEQLSALLFDLFLDAPREHGECPRDRNFHAHRVILHVHMAGQ